VLSGDAQALQAGSHGYLVNCRVGKDCGDGRCGRITRVSGDWDRSWVSGNGDGRCGRIRNCGQWPSHRTKVARAGDCPLQAGQVGSASCNCSSTVVRAVRIHTSERQVCEVRLCYMSMYACQDNKKDTESSKTGVLGNGR
jgi:hypothetical protein